MSIETKNKPSLKNRLGQFWLLVKKNLKVTIRDKQALIWLFGYPLLCMLMYSIAFTGGGDRASYSIVIINNDTLGSTNPQTDYGANTSLIITDLFNTNEDLKNSFILKTQYDNGTIIDEKGGRQLVLDENIDALIIIPQNFSEVIIGSTSWYSDANAGNIPSLIALQNSNFPSGAPTLEILTSADPITVQIIPSVFESIVNEIILTTNQASALEIDLDVGSDDRHISYFDYSAPGFALLGVLVSISSLAAIIGFEKHEGILDRLDTTPIPRSILLGSSAGAQLLFSAVQIMILFGSMFLFGVNVHPDANWFLALFISLLFALVCIGLGLIVASIAKNAKSGADLAWIFILPIQFLGGIFFEVDAPFTKAIPSTYANSALRRVVLYAENWSGVLNDIFILLGFALVLNVIGLYIFMKKKKI